MTTNATGHHNDKLADRVAAGIRRHREGDPAALGELAGAVIPWIFHIAYACGLSRHSADDVVQGTMESVLAHLPKLRDPDCGLAWMSVIARREAIRLRREERRTDPVEDPETLPLGIATDDPEGIAMAHLSRDMLLRAIAKLPDRQRALLQILFYGDPLDYASIAKRLDIPVGSIGPTRMRGLQRVRELIAVDRDWDGAVCA
jgi:RNA polymerase sigma factor (sigma-70 family)